MTKVLLVSHDLIADRMAGVGIRYYEIACALSRTHDVTLAAPAGSALPSSVQPKFNGVFITYDPSDGSCLREPISKSTVLFAYPETIWGCHESIKESTVVVVDGYDLALLEHLELDVTHLNLEEQLTWHKQYQRTNQYVLQRGDFFLCATTRQRDWWLGALASAGRLNALTHQQSSSFTELVDLLPYGIPEPSPTHTRPVIRDIIPGIAPQDKIVLWGGGIWQWLDPLTLIRAADIIAHQRSDIKFIFPGVYHPAEQIVPKMEIQQQALDLAESLNLLNRSVFVGAWVPYADWQNYIAESDVGISLHRDHLEAHMSSRTRVLSYIWGGLPMVLTRGDELAIQMAAAGVAQLVDEQNETAVAEAILKAVDLPKGNLLPIFDSLRPAFYWKNVIGALNAFCTHPHRANDAGIVHQLTSSDSNGTDPTNIPSPLQPIKVNPVPLLNLPAPNTPISRTIEPLVRSMGLWYVISIINQQNQINQLLQSQLEQLVHQQNELQDQMENLQKLITVSSGETSNQIELRLSILEKLQSDIIITMATKHADTTPQ